MKKIRSFQLLLLMALVALTACRAAIAQPTANPTKVTPTIVVATSTQTPEPTLTPTSTLTNTPEPTATPTLIPFKGFTADFRFYRSWYDNNRTIFYFLNASLDQPLYAKIAQYQLICNHDPETQSAMKCISEDRIEIESESTVPIEFFADERFTQSVFLYNIKIPKALVPLYSNAFDCPDRGQNVQCEYEYRKYESYCSTSITCYDACGYYYSIDNLPPEPDAPWVPIGSCQ